MDENQSAENKLPKEKSMQTSGSSEIFDSWTLVTEKSSSAVAAASKGVIMPNKDEESDDANRVEILSSGDKPDENCNDDDNKSKSSSAEASEDLSDGISIISDSDSVGRLSPRRSRPKHPNSLDENYDPNYDILKNEEDLPGSSSAHTNCCERSSQTSKSANEQPPLPVLKKRKRHSSTGSQSSLGTRQATSLVGEKAYFFPTIRNGLTSFFYVAVLLAILAFIGKLRYPEWQPLVKSSQLTEMEARIIDLELQNNLLRAEFDILSKQVSSISNNHNEYNQRFKGKGEGMPPPSRKNPNRPQSSIPPPINNGNRKAFNEDIRDWPDDIQMVKASAFSCFGNNDAKCSSQQDPVITNTLSSDQPQADASEKDTIANNAIPNQEAPTPKPFPSSDNFDSMNFPQHKNFKPDFKPGHKNGKHQSKKHSGERYDSRENFKRHEKPMKHQKPLDDHHQFKKYPDQQQKQFRPHHHKSSGEDFIDSREHGNQRFQRRNSNFENDKNRYREKPPHLKDGGDNWYIARGDDRQQARSGDGIRHR